MNLVHLIVRQWRKRPARTLLSVFSVSIAVAAVLGTALAQSSVREGSRGLTRVVEGRPALDIVSSVGGRILPADVPDASDIPGVVTSFPVVSRATLARVHGKRLRSILVGLPLESQQLWDTLPIRAGRVCQDPGESLLVADVAKTFDAKVGDRLTLLTRRGPRSTKIVGLVDGKALGELAPAATLAMPLSSVQELFGLDGQVDRIRVLVDSRDVRPRAAAALAARLPEGMVVEIPGEQLELADTVLRSTELALLFSGAFSLAMAGFIILNTLRMNFGERRRDVAVLRVLGATSGQIVALHLVEGMCLGLLGSILGIPMGLLLGRGLGQVMQRVMAADIAAPEPPYTAIVIALILGPLVACLAAIMPALQSRHVSAQEALGGAEPRRAERFPKWAIAGGAISMLTAIGLMLPVLSGNLPTEAAIPVGLLMLVSFIAVIPALLAPVVRVSASLLSPWARMEGDLAAEQLLARPIRTGLTAGVLVVAINTGLGLGNAIINNVNDVRQWYRRWIAADVSLVDPSVFAGGATADERPEIRAQIASQPDVAQVIEMRFFPARANGAGACCIVRSFADNGEVPWPVSSGNEAETVDRLRKGEMVVGSVLANKLKLHVGDEIRVELSGRAFALRVAAVANDYTLGGMVMYLDQGVAATLVGLGPAAMYLVHANPGVAVEPLLERLEKLGRETGLVVQSFPQLREQLDRLIGGIVGALAGLLGIGFVVGGIAVGNTLTMSVLEQTRELGLLRIVGMTRGQIRKLVFCESLLLGVVGALMGILAGVVTATVIHLCTEPLTGHSIPFTFHGALVAANAGGCLLVAALAGWSPGERAARLNLLEAIAYE